ncbi:MAG: N-acetylmuramoyl-L-alanine amidase [Sporichthyaceae bacterium]|nr:N-acetylmuramoyl-L-alanine amidase [Sporichthyaceae bacterium]
MPVERSYRLGDTGPAVAEIRRKLARLGLLPADEVSGVGDTEPGPNQFGAATFDEATDRAVRAFQQQRGILVDGIVGTLTYYALDEARWRLGDRILFYVPARLLAGDDVATLQQRLLDMGFDCGRVDGLFGVETELALREFQRNIGVRADGTCGPATFKALDRLSRTVTGGSPHAMRDSEAINRAGPTLAGKMVIVDPGHGGADSGVSGRPLNEGMLMYDLASRVEGRLAATGCSAFLTRGPEHGDTAPSETDRASFANAAGADLLISLHVAAHANPLAAGVATYFYGADRFGHRSAIGERFAGLVQREICARTDLVDCRTHAMNWDLLRRTRMPAVRTEVGYLTNPGVGARLADPAFRDVVAEAVVVAVQRLYLPPDQDAETGFLRIPARA